jgi:hypothetical protein
VVAVAPSVTAEEEALVSVRTIKPGVEDAATPLTTILLFAAGVVVGADTNIESPTVMPVRAVAPKVPPPQSNARVANAPIETLSPSTLHVPELMRARAVPAHVPPYPSHPAPSVRPDTESDWKLVVPLRVCGALPLRNARPPTMSARTAMPIAIVDLFMGI